MRPQVFDKERVHWNTAWMKKGGEHVEVVVNPDEALAFRRSGGKTDIRECLRSEHIFSDAKRGLHASEDVLTKLFGTETPLDVAKTILLEGEIQLSSEHRAKLREEKRNKIISQIHAYAVDPKTGTPHPRKRIELAIEEAKVHFDERKDIEEQVQEIVRKLQPVIPIKLETVTLQLHVPAQYGQKLYGDLERAGRLKKTEWLPDGSLLAWIELPAGLQGDLIEELASKTHGAVEAKKVDETPMK